MKTVQILKRDFMGGVVQQKHDSGFFCINDLTSIANKYRKNQGLPEAKWEKYAKAKKTQEFMRSLMKQENIADIVIAGKGRYSKTWVHPLVFFDYAMWLSPDFKIKVYEWLYDNMTIFRDESGESYKKLAGIVREHYTVAQVGLAMQNIARAIKRDLGVSDWNNTTPKKLQQRDEIHKSLSMLLKAKVDLKTAYALALEGVQENKDSTSNQVVEEL